MAAPDLSNLGNCVEDVYQAQVNPEAGPEDPSEYDALKQRLAACHLKLPLIYQQSVSSPFRAAVDAMGQEKFTRTVQQGRAGSVTAWYLFDISHVILQNGEGYMAFAGDAFQEVVSDLYDGFLSAEDRENVKRPEKGAIAPLVKWGIPEQGPYTLTTEGTQTMGIQAALVSLPPAYAKGGLPGWASLSHETAGHDILEADVGLRSELKSRVYNALQGLGTFVQDYWSMRIEEAAADVMGILNMGPAAGLGVIGFLRGVRKAGSGTAELLSQGSDAYHPVDVLRGYLAASAVRLLIFSGAKQWGDALGQEVDKDAGQIKIEGVPISLDEARQSARIVAETIATGKLTALEMHALGDIQNWRDTDEAIASGLSALLTGTGELPQEIAAGTYAAHAVAAAMTAAAAAGADIPRIFKRMQELLRKMHENNPCWGPLCVAHPGDIIGRISAYG